MFCETMSLVCGKYLLTQNPNSMKNLTSSLLLFLLTILSCHLYAQNNVITGTVVDEKGGPLPGSSVLVKGTLNGVSTDIDGNFSINAKTTNILVVSFVGYVSREIVVGSQTNIKVALKPQVDELDEVVVVAYGVQKRENVTGSVSTVNLDKIDSKPITNLSQAFAGLSAGVTAVQSSSMPGGSGASVTIRGLSTLGGTNNAPLVVIDGAVGGSLNDVSPNDVASISMLKDASSTALYGARAAAGVILVTTKRGKAGDMVVKYDGYYGFDKATELPDVISNSATYMELLRERTNTPDFPSDELINEFRSDAGANPLRYPNTDWYEKIMGGNAFMSSHNISVNGGSEKVRIAASLNYLDQDGLIVNTGYQRIGFRANFDAKISDKLNVGMNLSGTNGKRKSPGGDIQKVISHIHSTVPYVVPQYTDGRFGADGFTGSGSYNPVSTLNSRYSERETNSFVGKIFGSYQFTPDLKFTTSVNVNNVQSNILTQQKAYQLWHFVDDSKGAGDPTNSMSESNNRNRILTLNSTLTYNTTIDDNHDLGVLIGYSEEENLWNTSWSSGKGLADESIFVMDGPLDQTTYTLGGNKTLNNLRSYFGRFNYAYKSKYLLEASFRYDGSSKFRKDLRWGFFPSVSAGWNIHKEDFMKNLETVSSLKLRASWGQVGNNRSLGNYSSISTLQFGSDYSFGDVIQPGVYLNELANPELIWESTTTQGIGLDFGLWGNKLTGEIDLFKNVTDGILRRVIAPLFGGLPKSAFENLAEVESKGYEVAINYRNRDHAVKYSAGLTFSHSENKIVAFNDGQFQEVTGSIINKVGHPINSIYTYECEGLFRTQEQIDKHATQANPPQIGDLMYKDQLTVDTDGDGVADASDGIIDASDRVIMEPKAPKINAGLNLNVEYKNFDINILLQGTFGSKGLLTSAPVKPFVYPGRGITGKEWINAYHETRNPDLTTNIPRLDESSGNFIASDYWMQDFSFVRIKTLQLGYTFSESLCKRIGIKKCRIYVNGQNLFTFEDVPHYDPESVGAVYPLTKTQTVGVQLTF